MHFWALDTVRGDGLGWVPYCVGQGRYGWAPKKVPWRFAKGGMDAGPGGATDVEWHRLFYLQQGRVECAGPGAQKSRGQECHGCLQILSLFFTSSLFYLPVRLFQARFCSFYLSALTMGFGPYFRFTFIFHLHFLLFSCFFLHPPRRVVPLTSNLISHLYRRGNGASWFSQTSKHSEA